MIDVKEYVDIKNYSSLKIGGQFRYFASVNNKDDLDDIFIFVEKHEVPIFILGGGSNIVFSDGVINVLALKIEIKNLEIIEETDEYAKIKVGAGGIWDNFIEKTIEMNLSGLESLSAIPGTVGATPVQNVGAYGSEVKDTIIGVEVFDIKENIIKNLSNKDCNFRYRDSIFKNEAKGKYIIIAVIFKLKKVSNNFDLLKKREEIINTRWSKLPRPEELPNVGSFFKNPIVSKDVADKILKDFPNGKFFDADESMTKIPAGWLIDMAGLKGKSFGNVAVYDKNALVLINTGNATKEDILNTRDEIVKIVKDKFDITLEQEPEVI